jgi:hypothetical protein
MTRINAVRSMNQIRSVAWGKQATTWGKTTSALIFAALLIVCSVTVGCSSDNKPKPVSSNIQVPVPAAPAQLTPMPALQAAAKPAPKKVVPKKPATVNYADKTYGVTFEYPRRYAIETGDAAADLLASNPLAMNFVQPGGVALAAVELPETTFANTDFSSAFFNVSVNKSLTAEQCTEFAVPQSKVAAKSEMAPASSTEVTKEVTKDPTPTSNVASDVVSNQAQPASIDQKSTDQKSDAKSADSASNSKLMLGDLELLATEAVSGEGTRQSDSKYFHVYQNGSCYEFALNVTTDASEQGVVKRVDRDKVFTRLEQILATVKIDAAKIDAPKTTPETATEVPAVTPVETPAQ